MGHLITNVSEKSTHQINQADGAGGNMLFSAAHYRRIRYFIAKNAEYYRFKCAADGEDPALRPVEVLIDRRDQNVQTACSLWS